MIWCQIRRRHVFCSNWPLIYVLRRKSGTCFCRRTRDSQISLILKCLYVTDFVLFPCFHIFLLMSTHHYFSFTSILNATFIKHVDKRKRCTLAKTNNWCTINFLGNCSFVIMWIMVHCIWVIFTTSWVIVFLFFIFR